MAMTKKGLRNSEGWTWPTPNSIQRRAPLCSGPTIGTKIEQHEEECGAEQREPPRASPSASSKCAIITGMPTAIQAS